MKSVLFAVVVVLSSSAFASVDAFPSFLNFRDTVVGQRSLQQQFTVTNRGPDRISSVSISSFCNGFEVQSGSCLGPLNNGQSCYATVTFVPRLEGSASCSINVRAGSSFDTVSAQGRGVRRAFPEPAVAEVRGAIPPDKDVPCTGGSQPTDQCKPDDHGGSGDSGGGNSGDGRNDDDGQGPVPIEPK